MSLPPPPPPRLEGWGEIAQYLGVTQRSAQRWALDLGLPVHREERSKRSAVFAYPHEIDAWRKERRKPPASEKTADPVPTTPSRWPGMGIAAGIVVTLFVIVFFYSRKSDYRPTPTIQLGRLLVRSTSEGRAPKRIQLTHQPLYLALSPGGEKLAAADQFSRTLSIVHTSDRTVHALKLPSDVGSIVMAPNGILYVGSSVEGIRMVDMEKEALLQETIPTGGPVRDMAITPDGSKIFLAMEYSGLKRLRTRTRSVNAVSDRVCPEHLGIDPQGKNLYVTYQCAGPLGKSGHDSVEMYDVEKESSSWIFSGPPMVGGATEVSPDGKLVLVDGRGACWEQQYDHRGCPPGDRHVYYLLRPVDRRLLWTFNFPQFAAPGAFLDDSRLTTLGPSISVRDAARYTELERWEPADAPLIAIAPDTAHSRVYLSSDKVNVIWGLEMERPECTPPRPGLAMFYPADGAYDDAIGLNSLTPHGSVRFIPGRVGQSFFLDGNSFLSQAGTGGYSSLLQHEFSVVVYAKLSSTEGEMVLLDSVAQNPQVGIRLLKSVDNHFAFQWWPGGALVKSKITVQKDVWYQVVATRAEQGVTLYVNGRSEDGRTATQWFDAMPAMFLGGRSPGQPAFRGWLDEVAFYNRALAADEVKALHELRESGPCRL